MTYTTLLAALLGAAAAIEMNRGSQLQLDMAGRKSGLRDIADDDASNRRASPTGGYNLIKSEGWCLNRDDYVGGSKYGHMVGGLPACQDYCTQHTDCVVFGHRYRDDWCEFWMAAADCTNAANQNDVAQHNLYEKVAGGSSSSSSSHDMTNHLDITDAARAACVSGAVTNADGTVRAPLTGGAACSSEASATCATKYEEKTRGGHRQGQDEAGATYASAYDLVGELHLCEWREELRRCEAGRVLTVCPEGDDVVEAAATGSSSSGASSPRAQRVGGPRFTNGDSARRWENFPGFRFFYGKLSALTSTCEATCLQDPECWGFGTGGRFQDCYVWTTTTSTDLVATAFGGSYGLCTGGGETHRGCPEYATELKPGSTSTNGFAQLGAPTGTGDLDDYYLICGEDRGVATDLEGYCGSSSSGASGGS